MSAVPFFMLCVFLFLLYNPCCGQEQFKYDAQNKRNPFVPLVTPDGKLLKVETEEEENAAGLSLEGIICGSDGRSYAIVNGEIIKTGDSIGEYQVLKIEKDKVTFIKDGEPLQIELYEEEQ